MMFWNWSRASLWSLILRFLRQLFVFCDWDSLNRQLIDHRSICGCFLFLHAGGICLLRLSAPCFLCRSGKANRLFWIYHCSCFRYCRPIVHQSCSAYHRWLNRGLCGHLSDLRKLLFHIWIWKPLASQNRSLLLLDALRYQWFTSSNLCIWPASFHYITPEIQIQHPISKSWNSW